MTINRLPDNLPEILRAAGLKVVETDGWRTRGRPGAFAPVGVLCHHTATTKKWTIVKVLNLLIHGRPDLNGPLCQIGLGRTGIVYLIAAGRANHAGKAKASGTVPEGDGNTLYIGIEAFNDGVGEAYPREQYDAYVKLCAVLSLKVTKSPVTAVRAHKETSVTGKIDPTFNMKIFRNDVEAQMEKMRPKPSPKPRTIKLQHSSLQFSDTPVQKRADVERMFSTGRDFITWTEASQKNILFKLIKEIGPKHGYTVFAHKWGTGVAVKNTFGSVVKTGYVPSIPGEAKQHSPRGIAWMTVRSGNEVITTGAVHYVTGGRVRAQGKRFFQNVRFSRAIGKFAAELGNGRRLVFINGDFNINDKRRDVFFGQPLTTCWDEIKKWPSTGHGPIDAIASFDGDIRTKCVDAMALNDSKMPLHSDHFTVFATYEVRK